MVGETLDNVTQGGNSKDRVAAILTDHNITRLYSRDGTYSSTAVRISINNGTHFVNHLGHANYVSVMGQSAASIAIMTNTEYCLVYSIGCYSAAFDNATSGSNEAVAEHFILANHGAFAYIGNSRYGWYAPNSTEGTGDRYDRSFFDAIINEKIRPAGKALKDSKEDLISSSHHRWTHYTLNLLGDPETPIYIYDDGINTTTTTSTSTTRTTTTTSTTTTSTSSSSTSTSTTYSSTTTTRTTTTSTTSTTRPCNLEGDYPACGEITLAEVVAHTNRWAKGEASLNSVIRLINAWASD
jgi:hypothetical protein